MKLLGLTKLNDFMAQHGDVVGQLSAWRTEVLETVWDTPRDIKARYPSASFLPNNRVIFNIKGNHYRLEVKVDYQHQLVLIKRIGTHAEYSKWEF